MNKTGNIRIISVSEVCVFNTTVIGEYSRFIVKEDRFGGPLNFFPSFVTTQTRNTRIKGNLSHSCFENSPYIP